MLDKVVDALIGETVHEVLDKLKYSEIRLRLLNKFGLKSDTPPNDFEGVYVYTLIEYGVGKQKVILQLILQLFKSYHVAQAIRLCSGILFLIGVGPLVIVVCCQF